MTWGVVLDPSEVAVARVELDVNSDAILVDQAGIDWGDAAITAAMAQQKWGSTPVDFEVPNRIITIPLLIGGDADQSSFDTARTNLQQKVALLQAEGGWLKRESDVSLYADVVNATLTLPDKLGETGAVEPDVSLQLECLPDFYADEITLDTIAATGVAHAVLQASGSQAVIEGDYPARCRIIVSDASGNDQHGLIWGVRSRHYDPASTAALFYEAEALTPLNGAAAATQSGASGGHVVQHTTLPGSVWVSILSTNLLSGGAPLTHTGSYRVKARVSSASATPQLRFLWGIGSLAVPTQNDPVTVPAPGGEYIVDLGEIRIDAAPVGTNEWFGVIQVMAAVTDDPIAADCIYLEPLDESAGELAYLPIAPSSSVQAGESPATLANDASVGTVAWTIPGPGPDRAGCTLGPIGGGGGTVVTEYLKATACGFAIPSGATIIGIVAQMTQQCVTGSQPSPSTVLHLVKAGTVQATARSGDHFFMPETFADVTYGSATDLWGTTWTPSDINNAGFGIALEATVTLPGSVTVSPEVGAIAVFVYYTLASGFTIVQDAIIYASQNAEIRTEGPYRAAPSGGVYGRISNRIGDLPRLPPSGLEARAVELLVKPTRGDLGPLADSGLDGLTAVVKYRPCYLARN